MKNFTISRRILCASLALLVCSSASIVCAGAPSEGQVKDAGASQEQSISGKVLETMDSGGYTYVNLEKDGKKSWVAVPRMKVSVGEEVQLRPGMEMGKFSSKTLNRTFDSIVFSAGPVVAKPASPHGSLGKTAAMPGQHPAMGGGTAPESPAFGNSISGKVVETMNSGGYTYVSLEKEGKNTWVAMPTTKVSVGEELEVQGGQAMANFTSKTLNRTFESVVFSGGIVKK